ncbi:hypothetical protein OCD79_04580 [Bacillus wiedmannii]|uniref:hypothetical protein n=1 Tax=Bacillus cereus group TaxID=86661 RepID=UPI0007DB35D3|nr:MULTISPECIES: hypothetical protein [Bacillus cereus group]MCU5110712.1 hypothetical protein [Bacillus wiedmannii]MCU5150537.1 hypothetical protein [Bacillus wiedmannii]MCU5410893.1 hypothetical protein [Bacillus wiedmannii]MED3615444.1 hypothetical protein [Bacillus wiedmannii]OAK09761.1 hypothetical protein A6280_23800 [Bacillus wiedmannii]
MVHIQHLYKLLRKVIGKEDLKLEPPALAAVIGPISRKRLYTINDLKQILTQSTHIVWGTGGSMVPKEVMEEHYQNRVSVN